MHQQLLSLSFLPKLKLNLSLTYSGKFINRPYKKIKLKLDAFSVQVLCYKCCTYSVNKPPQEDPFLDKTNLRGLRVGAEPVDKKHKTVMRRRCEVKCRHVTPYKLLRHKFVMFRKYFGRYSADYCGTESPCESPRNKVAACSLFLRQTPIRSRADVALDLFSSARRKRFCRCLQA